MRGYDRLLIEFENQRSDRLILYVSLVPSQFSFKYQHVFKVIANFDGGRITSNAEILSLAELDENL